MTDAASPFGRLAATARWTAAVRARETAREDALIDDPYAAAFAGPEGEAWIAGRPADASLPMLLRTRYFDDYLRRVARDTEIRQFVILAAGFDMRAFRLDWPPRATVYELDLPGVMQEKDSVIAAMSPAARCARVPIAADLTAPFERALEDAGFAAAEPSCWLLEGFLFYLDNVDMQRILDAVLRFAARGSRIGFDVVNSVMLTSSITKAWIDMQAQAGAPWLGTMDDPAAVLAERGWTASITQAGAPDANFGRWTYPVIPVDMPGMPHNWFVTGGKR